VRLCGAGAAHAAAGQHHLAARGGREQHPSQPDSRPRQQQDDREYTVVQLQRQDDLTRRLQQKLVHAARRRVSVRIGLSTASEKSRDGPGASAWKRRWRNWPRICGAGAAISDSAWNDGASDVGTDQDRERYRVKVALRSSGVRPIGQCPIAHRAAHPRAGGRGDGPRELAAGIGLREAPAVPLGLRAAPVRERDARDVPRRAAVNNLNGHPHGLFHWQGDPERLTVVLFHHV
jgi:hypothetical protein